MKKGTFKAGESNGVKTRRQNDDSKLKTEDLNKLDKVAGKSSHNAISERMDNKSSSIKVQKGKIIKEQPTRQNLKTHFAKSLLKNSYEKKILGEHDVKEKCWCKTCSKSISFQYRKNHLLSNLHWNNTPVDCREKMLVLAKLYDDDWKPSEEDQAIIEDEHSGVKGELNKGNDLGQGSPKFLKNLSKEAKSEFLGLICFMITERFSFEQIVRLGNFLQTRYTKSDKLKFIKDMSWDSEIIRNLINDCVAKDLKERLYKDLENSPFSLSLDTTTLMGDQILAIRTRYLKEIYDETLKTHIPTIQNHILAIENLRASSIGQVFYDIVEERALYNETLKNNLVGLCHDGASNLTGKEKGLAGLIGKNIKENFYDLHDPCHCYNLALEEALNTLPEDIMKLIVNLHSHFNHSSQRQVELNMIQEEAGLPVLKLKNYAKTRWLSVGESMERAVRIWDSLVLYFEHIAEKKGKFKLKKKTETPNLSKTNFLKLLKDEELRATMKIISIIILKLNSFNKRLQTHKLEIQRLKFIVYETLNLFMSFLLNANNHINEAWLSEFTNLEDIPEDSFKNPSDLIDSLQNMYPNELKDLGMSESLLKQTIGRHIKGFLFTLVESLIERLPLFSPIFNCIDFVHLRDESKIFEEKIRLFAKELSGLNEEEESLLTDELIKLKTFGQPYFTNQTKSSLLLWKLIEEEGFVILPFLAKKAQAIATTSADVEQAFSYVKLIKTDKRSQLKPSTLESILIIWSFFKNSMSVRNEEEKQGIGHEENFFMKIGFNIKITDRMLDFFDSVINALNERKGKRTCEMKEDKKRKHNIHEIEEETEDSENKQLSPILKQTRLEVKEETVLSGSDGSQTIQYKKPF